MAQGCTAPAHLREQASRTLQPNCLEHFTSLQYQNAAQEGRRAVFTLAVSEDRTAQVCHYAVGGLLTLTEEGARVFSLNQCERHRTAWIQRNQKPMNECRVYAIGNNIVY